MKIVILLFAMCASMIHFSSLANASGSDDTLKTLPVNDVAFNVEKERPKIEAADTKANNLPGEELKEKSQRWLDLILAVLAFESTVAALMIPISFEMLTRLTDKYDSSTGLTKLFQSEWEFKVFKFGWPSVVVIFLLTHFFYNFFYNNFYFLPYFLILAISLWIIFFFLKLLKYLDDTDYVKAKLLGRARNVFQ